MAGVRELEGKRLGRSTPYWPVGAAEWAVVSVEFGPDYEEGFEVHQVHESELDPGAGSLVQGPLFCPVKHTLQLASQFGKCNAKQVLSPNLGHSLAVGSQD